LAPEVVAAVDPVAIFVPFCHRYNSDDEARVPIRNEALVDIGVSLIDETAPPTRTLIDGIVDAG
jgi:hypothetical protein